MIDISFLRSYTKRLLDAIPAINHENVVIDDSQLVNFLSEIETADKHLLYAVIPGFSNNGSNVDNKQKQAETVFMVLQKTSYSDITHEEFLDLMQATLETANAIEAKMIEDKLDHSETGCQYMKLLNVGSISIDPVWGYAGCNGWSIEFNFVEL